MTKSHPIWLPRYSLTPAIARALMEIEAGAPWLRHKTPPPAAEAQLRRRASDLLLPKLISGEVDVSDLNIETREPVS